MAHELRDSLGPLWEAPSHEPPPLPTGADDRFDIRAYRAGAGDAEVAVPVRASTSDAGRPAVEHLLEAEQEKNPEAVTEVELDLRETVRRLRTYLGPNGWMVATGVTLLVIAALVGLLQPMAARFILNRLSHGDSLTYSIIGLVVLVIVAALSLGFGSYLMLRSAETIIATGRKRLSERIIMLTMASVRRQAPGDLMSRVTSDTSMLRSIAIQSVTQAVIGSVTLVGALIAMATVDLFLLAVVVAVVVTLAATMSYVMPRVKAAASESQKHVGELGSELERALDGFVLVKASGSEQAEFERVEGATEAARDAGTRLARWTALAASGSGVSTNVAFLVVLAVGGTRVQSGELSTTDLVAFLLYVFYLTAPTLQLINASTAFQSGRAALGRIAAVEELPIEEEVEEDVAPDPHAWQEPASVRFDRVHFTYPGKASPAVEDLDLEIPAGGLTALVGPSGAGKSTIFSLLERFYLPQSGRVLLAGEDLTSWALADLRAAIAYVQQDTPVLAGSLRENLTYAAPDATDQEIAEALRTCRLEQMLERLGGDLDSPLTNHGGSISGGERQRVAVARALLRRPQLLLLDEVTSQLDASNESALRDAVLEVAKHTTVIVSAHRLSTVRKADRILVIEDARLRDVGSHEELLKRDASTAGSPRCRTAARPASTRPCRRRSPRRGWSRRACGRRGAGGS